MRKLRLILLLTGMLSALPGNANAEPFPPTTPEFVTVDENSLFLGSLPDAPTHETITRSQLMSLLTAIKAEGLEYRYIIGSCEDRAHFITMIAKKAGLPISKIWAIAPARTTLLSRELITVADPYGVVKSVTWGHHVAPVVLLENGTPEPDALVIDLSLSPNAAMPLRAWIQAINSPRSSFFATGDNDYLFYSLNGFNIYNNGSPTVNYLGEREADALLMPSWFPNILTGDFQKYDLGNWDEAIAAGLATNDLAMAIFDDKLKVDKKDATLLHTAILEEDSINSLVANPPGAGLTAQGSQAVKTFFSDRKSHWLGRIAAQK